MTRQEMIDAIVTGLMLNKDEKSKEDAIELILRRGWKGLDNFSDEELKHELEHIDEKGLKFLLSVADLIASVRVDEQL